MRQLAAREKEVTLLDLLDRILNKGVILWGDVTLSVADVDLVYLGLKVLLTSVETAERMRGAGSCYTQPERNTVTDSAFAPLERAVED